VTQPPKLRPLGIGEILDVALKIVWRNAGTLARVVVFIVFPVQVVSAIVLASATPDNTNLSGNGSFNTTTSNSDVGAVLGAFFVILLLTLISSTLSSGACFRAIASAYLGEKTSWRESLRFALRRVHSLLWVTILGAIVAGFCLLLFVIPGVYLWVSFAVAVPVLLTEDLKGRKALGRSRRLVKGFWWRTFGVVVLGYILSGILSSAIGALVVGITSIESNSGSFAGIVVSVVAGTVSKLLTVPFVAAFVTVLYFDLRVRKEAFDLQLLASRIGVEPDPAALAAPVEPVDSGDKPPFWPPPPGWKPSGGDGG
jgi:hypothetical protein